MNAGRAFVAGMIGGAAMSAMMWVGRSVMGLEANLSMMLGTMVVQPPGGVAWVAGFVMHLMISGAIALLYAWGFEHVTHRAGAGTGALFSLLHSLVAGVTMGMMPAMHPLIDERMPAPGMFLANYGTGHVIALFVMHAVYGAIVGAMYGTVRHPHVRPADGGVARA